MKRAGRSTLAALAMMLAASLATAEPAADLIQKLRSGTDFRIRVQAALELGKKPGDVSRQALERALSDENAAVRAAAAAGLKVLGDPAAIPALQKRADDPSAAVRAQISSSVDSLRRAEAQRRAAKPEVMVRLGKFRGRGANGALLDDFARTSRKKLGELPGVAIVEDEQPRGDVPLVMLTGQVKKLEQSRDGASVTYLASIEFVLHKMPGQNIRGMFSGSARASGSAAEIADAAAMEDLRKSAIEAAIESAVRRAPQALRAALE